MKRPSRRKAAGALDQKLLRGRRGGGRRRLLLVAAVLMAAALAAALATGRGRSRRSGRRVASLRGVRGHGGSGNSEGQQCRGNQGSGLIHRVSSGGIDERTEEYAG